MSKGMWTPPPPPQFPKPSTMKMSDDRFAHAANRAYDWYLNNIGKPDRNSPTDDEHDRLKQSVIGTIGESAFALFLGKDYEATKRGDVDVANKYEVRCRIANMIDERILRIRPRDRDEAIFVLVSSTQFELGDLINAATSQLLEAGELSASNVATIRERLSLETVIVRVYGWIYAREGKKDIWIDPWPPADYRVPLHAIHSISSLPR